MIKKRTLSLGSILLCVVYSIGMEQDGALFLSLLSKGQYAEVELMLAQKAAYIPNDAELEQWIAALKNADICQSFHIVAMLQSRIMSASSTGSFTQNPTLEEGFASTSLPSNDLEEHVCQKNLKSKNTQIKTTSITQMKDVI